MAVVADSKVKTANRKTQGNNPGSGSYIPQGPLTMIGNGINRLNTGLGTGIDRVFDATLGNAVRALTNDSVDPTKWLSGEDVGTGLDIIEDIGLGMVSVPALVAKVLAQNSEGLTESILGVDAETGQDLDMKQRALKGLGSVGNVALSAVPGIGKAMKAGSKAIGKAGEESIEKVIKDLTKSNADKLTGLEKGLSDAESAYEAAKSGVATIKDTTREQALKAIRAARKNDAALRPWEMSADDLLAMDTKGVNPYKDIPEYTGGDVKMGKGFRSALKNTQQSIKSADKEIADLENFMQGYKGTGPSNWRTQIQPDGSARRLYYPQAQKQLADMQSARADLPLGLKQEIQQLEKAARRTKSQAAEDALVRELNGEVEGVRKNYINALDELENFTPDNTSDMQAVIDALAGKGDKAAAEAASPDFYDRVAGRVGKTADTFRESGFRDAMKTLTGRDKQTIESVAEELGEKIGRGQALTSEEQASLRNLMEVAQNGNKEAAERLNDILGKEVFDATGKAADNAVKTAEDALQALKDSGNASADDLKAAKKALSEAKKAAKKEGNKASNVISKSMEKGGRGITRGAIGGIGDTIASGLNAEANYRAENPGGSLFQDDPGLLFASVLSGLLGGRRLARNLPGMRGISQNGFGGVRSNIPYGAISAAAMGTAGADRQDIGQLDPAVLNELNKMYGYNLNGEE